MPNNNLPALGHTLFCDVSNNNIQKSAFDQKKDCKGPELYPLVEARPRADGFWKICKRILFLQYRQESIEYH